MDSVPRSRHWTRLLFPDRTLISPRSSFSACHAPAGGVVAVGVGVGVAAGVAVDVAVGVLVGVAVGVVGLPVQAVPLSAKPVGTGLLPDHEPLNPKDVLAPDASPPLYAAFVAVTCDPLWAVVALHAWITLCPAPNVHVRVHPVTASPRLVIFTSAPKPLDHWLVTV